MYDNIRMLSEDGRLLSYIDKKRMSFYLRKDLATQIDESTIRLKFKHRAEGTISFFKDKLSNNCVVCGISENLTRHHVVPYRFRKHMSELYKNSNSYDVLRLCGDCHSTYEIEADKLDKMLIEFISPEVFLDLKNAFFNKERVYRICKMIVLYGKDFLTLPQATSKLKDLAESIDKCDLEKTLTIEEVSNIRSGFFHKQYNDAISVEILKSCGTEESFIMLWRRHFLEYAKPKHLPKLWEENLDKTF